MSVVPKSDLEEEYSPSKWSPRFLTSIDVLKYHVEYVTAANAAVSNIPHKLGIEYGSTIGQKLDVFGLDLPNDSPILVYIHGGYWQELSREISRYPVQPLHKAKVKTIIVGYDLCPTVALYDIVEQIKNAATFVLKYAENMCSRGVYFAGHSAGAHLAAKLLASENFLGKIHGSHRLQGFFLISGVYDLRDIIHTSINDAIRLSNESATSLSPMLDDYGHLQRSNIR